RDGLPVADQLLAELLAGLRPDELDRDVAVRLPPRQADHLLGQVDDAYRLAHVEDVHLAATPDRTRLDDELNRLRDRHEVPRHLRMRDADRAALGDLLAEDGDDAAGRVEHVPEPHRDETGAHVVPVAVRLDDPLAQRLRLPHDGLRVRGLVGGDEHEPLRPEVDGNVRHRPRPERVVADGLERVRLHHGDVLVGRGVEDHPRLILLEDLAHLRPVLDVSHDSRHGVEAALVDERALDLEQRRLRMVDKDQLGAGGEPRDLAAELRADRAAGARHEHDLVAEIAGDRVEVDLDRLAAEDVLDFDGPQLTGEVEVAGDQLAQARQRLDEDALATGDLEDPLAQLTRGGRDRDQHLVG